MTEASATLARRAETKSGYRGWSGRYAGSAARFRAPAVAASLILADLLAGIVAVALSRSLAQTAGIEAAQPERLPIATLILTFACLRLYTGWPTPYERFRLRTIGVAAFVAADAFIGLGIGQPGAVIVARVCEMLPLVVFGHYGEAVVRALLIQLELWGATTVLVGCGDKNQKLADLLLRQPELGLRPIGFVAGSRDEALHNAKLPLPLIGEAAHPERISAHVEFAIFSSADELSAVTRGADHVWLPSCRLLLAEDRHDFRSLWSRSRMLAALTGFEIRRDLRLRRNQLLKRVTDLALAIPIALLVWPVIAALAAAVKLVDPGPALYVQPRVGRSGKMFGTLKLRTMYADAERRLEEHLSRHPQACAEWQHFFKLSRDPRVLPIIGNFMRRTSLDELPQLWNVIRGDMSLVGPRPFPTYHLRNFDDQFCSLRAAVPPGITGWWQVSSRSNGDLEVQKLQDLFYIRNWSIWFDIYILLETVPVVLSGKGAR